MIRTVNGLLNPKDVKLASAHEHLCMDLRHVRNDEESILCDFKLQSEELKIMKDQGFNLIVDMSNQSMFRDPNHLKELSDNTGIHVIAATGYYLHDYHTKKLKEATIEEIKNEFINDIQTGINNSNIKAGVMGELATSSTQIFPSEKKVLIAAVEAQKVTGCPIFTHVDHGKNLMEQVEILQNAGANLSKVVIGHMDLVEDTALLEKVLQTGVNIAFDTIGKTGYVSSESRATKLLKLINLGYEEQIVLGQDISRKTYLTKFGGQGYGYLIRHFYPLIKEHINDVTWNKLISTNLVKILDF